MGPLPLLLLLLLLLLLFFLLFILLLLLITSFFMYISAAVRDLYENDRSSDHSNAEIWCADRSVTDLSVHQISSFYLYCGLSYDRFCEVIILLHSFTFYSVFFLLLLSPLWLELYCTVLYCTVLYCT